MGPLNVVEVEVGLEPGLSLPSVAGQGEQSQVYMDTASVSDVGPYTFNVSDDIRFVAIEIQVRDSDFDAHDQYDVSDEGDQPSLSTLFDRLSGSTTISGDGGADGGLSGLQGAITVLIESIPGK